MNLSGNLKKSMKNDTIMKPGMKLTDDDLDKVAGGRLEADLQREYQYYCDPRIGGCGMTFDSDTPMDRCIYCYMQGTLT